MLEMKKQQILRPFFMVSWPANVNVHLYIPLWGMHLLFYSLFPVYEGQMVMEFMLKISIFLGVIVNPWFQTFVRLP